MPTSKIRKSIAKRFKITKNGKVLRRSSGQDHLLSKQTGDQRRKRRKWVELHTTEVKLIKKNLRYTR